MRKSSAFALIGLLAIFLFSAGIVRLFAWRFSTGDSYPPYSSLRNDPLGTKVFYEALEGCGAFTVWRNFQSYRHIREQSDAVLLILGIPVWTVKHVDRNSVQALAAFVQDGGRLVITFYPVSEDDASLSSEKEPTDEAVKKKSRPLYESLPEKWGFKMNIKARETTDASRASALQTSSLPQSISCHTDLFFADPAGIWHTVFEREGHPVVIERELGNGTIVLSALSYFLSNEAMVEERHPSLLLWLSGSKTEVIFDEYSHGISKTPGVAALGRKYQLQWFLGGLLVLAILFVWRNTASFLPPYGSGAETGAVTPRKDQVDALTNLLRRNIAKSQVLGECYNEWAKSLGKADDSKQRMQKVEQLIHQARGEEEKKAVSVYNAISETLKRFHDSPARHSE